MEAHNREEFAKQYQYVLDFDYRSYRSAHPFRDIRRYTTEEQRELILQTSFDLERKYRKESISGSSESSLPLLRIMGMSEGNVSFWMNSEIASRVREKLENVFRIVTRVDDPQPRIEVRDLKWD